MKKHSAETLNYFHTMLRKHENELACFLLDGETYKRQGDGYAWATKDDPYSQKVYTYHEYLDDLTARRQFWTDIIYGSLPRFADQTTEVVFTYPRGITLSRFVNPKGSLYGIKLSGKRPIKIHVIGDMFEDEYHNALRRHLCPHVMNIGKNLTIEGELIKC